MKKIIVFILGFTTVVNAQGIEGIDWGITYTGAGIRLMGGEDSADKNLYLSNIDLQIEFSSESMNLWKGGTGFVYFLSNTGDDPSSVIGDAQTISNIEANNSSRLYEIWYNQVFHDEKMEILFGVHDLNSEFYGNDAAGLFNNSSFGIGPNLSGNAPVGIFNVAALGARLRYMPNERFNVAGAVYDGDPGDPDINSNGFGIRWNGDEGLMTIAEAQLSQGEEAGENVYRIGGWYHTSEFEDVSDSDIMRRGNYGVYVSLDRKLSSKHCAFVHGGIAPGDRSAVPSYIGFGVNTTELISSRKDDVFGLAVAIANLGKGGSEMVIEGVWQAQFGDHFGLKPDLQYVISPGGSESNKNIMVFGLRTEVSF